MGDEGNDRRDLGELTGRVSGLEKSLDSAWLRINTGPSIATCKAHEESLADHRRDVTGLSRRIEAAASREEVSKLETALANAASEDIVEQLAKDVRWVRDRVLLALGAIAVLNLIGWGSVLIRMGRLLKP